MQLETILTPERCFCNLPGVSKKRFLTTVSELIAEATNCLSADQIYTALLAREQLGSTGIGNGIAIPHCRVADCKSITGTLVKLEEGIDFDAIDSRAVDLLFVLIVPAEEMDEHLKVLGGLAALFHQDEFCNKLRQAQSAQELYDIATSF
ncbi:MAG: PTS IIA-like nitrogen regulatory protein PtsN [Gammaproteobacteria bacterium]|nr:PTS IIA-like nitrogen regulatory protein PtsN [Gammaproteobacteria bacterium]MDP2140221.1 PTS IIA-like nitrogen regulatory protein PtsN [Gammaproteobacteria bacterium]MDP2348097.1 PTS IIA-like nitrogen regulatory protein PtsN [Gammaproteobacteria bacterium]